MPKQINKNNKNNYRLSELKNENDNKITDASNKNDEDDPNMKILSERLEKIEKLVDNLAKTTRSLSSISKVITV